MTAKIAIEVVKGVQCWTCCVMCKACGKVKLLHSVS